MWNSYHVRCSLLISWVIGHKLKCLQESERELWSICIHDLCQLSVCCLSALNPPFLLLPGHTGPFLLTSPLPTGTMLNFIRRDTWGTVQEEKASLPGASLLFFVLFLLHVWQAAVSGHSMELILQHVFTSTQWMASVWVLLATQQVVFCIQPCSWHFSKLLSYSICHGHILINRKSRVGVRVLSFKFASSLGILARP